MQTALKGGDLENGIEWDQSCSISSFVDKTGVFKSIAVTKIKISGQETADWGKNFTTFTLSTGRPGRMVDFIDLAGYEGSSASCTERTLTFYPNSKKPQEGMVRVSFSEDGNNISVLKDSNGIKLQATCARSPKISSGSCFEALTQQAHLCNSPSTELDCDPGYIVKKGARIYSFRDAIAADAESDSLSQNACVVKHSSKTNTDLCCIPIVN